MKTLADIAKNGESEAARVSAATAILDRAYGRPKQAVEHSGPGGSPIEVADMSRNDLARRILHMLRSGSEAK